MPVAKKANSLMKEYLTVRPEISAKDLMTWLAATHGIKVNPKSVSQVIWRYRLSLKAKGVTVPKKLPTNGHAKAKNVVDLLKELKAIAQQLGGNEAVKEALDLMS